MRYLILTLFGVFAVVAMTMSTPVLASERKAVEAKAMTMEGYIIDTKCATANKDKLAEFVKTHEKECAMLPSCRKSGYNLYSDGKLYKFDKLSQDKVYKFLQKGDSKLHVKAEVTHEKGDMIKLVSITNAE